MLSLPIVSISNDRNNKSNGVKRLLITKYLYSIWCLLSKYKLIFLRVLKVFDKPLFMVKLKKFGVQIQKEKKIPKT